MSLPRRMYSAGHRLRPILGAKRERGGEVARAFEIEWIMAQLPHGAAGPRRHPGWRGHE